jgi:hypothetical protein
MTESTNIIDNIDEMIRLYHETIETLSKTKEALLLADLLGVSPSALKKPVRFVVRKGDSRITPWVGAVLSVRIGAEPYEDFKLADVDRRLWPKDMQQAWGLWQKRRGNKL